ncbi:hypothetical protein FRACYDRAFT_254701 [Fragilariopsis cylindrus CCMP1102]|uniref:Uncharacterized protein n=1 Tax=Fragilariopsis cylindrus CCMP1102 TaxID=635003 RepID=A0A1E7EKE7_9STRA|nr:hypothetical protein FRACYDRAFT_254701 [Fragilariopsis cylindrus CCMP1102]|eukprot:OEU06390.1 hypothetical protein FRACYDRAFT_254701 [Fragilariopsis cylindrus CCMP1102]
MMRMHPSSLQLDEQDQDHYSSTRKESTATNIVTHEVVEDEEEVKEDDHCDSDEEESLQVSDVELLMDNFSSALVSSLLTMDSGYIEYVNDDEDNTEDNAEDNEDESELNKFEYHDCSTRNQDDQHILIRGYKLIDNICCSIGSGAIVVPVEKEEEAEEGKEEVVTEVTSIESELNEVLLVPPPTLVESTTFDEVATPLVDDADIVAAAGAAAFSDAGDINNNDAWFEQFSAGYEDLCCCIGSTTSTTSTSIVPEPVAAVAEAVAEVLSDVQQGIVYSNMQLKKQPHSKEVDEKEKQEQEQVKEGKEESELILDDPRYSCTTSVPLSSSASSCGAQTNKSFMSTKTPLNSSKTKNSNMNNKSDDDEQTVCTNADTVVTNGTNKSTKSITTTTKKKSTVTKVEKLKEHLRDMVRVRARAFSSKKTFSTSSSFGNKSNNNNSTHVPSVLAPAQELLSPTEEFAFKAKKNNKQIKKKDKNHVMLSTSSTKKMTNCSASSKSFGRRKTSNAVYKRRPVLLSVTIEEEGHTEDISVTPLSTKAAANNNENENDEESKDVLSAIPKLIVPKKRTKKDSGVTDDETSVLSGITESNKSIHNNISRKEVNNDDQRDDDDTSLFFPEKSNGSILNPYPIGGSGLGSGSGLGNSTFDSGVDDASSQLYSLGSSNNDDESMDQTEYRNKSKDYYGHHSISDDADYLKHIYTVKPMHSGKQVKAGQLTL